MTRNEKAAGRRPAIDRPANDEAGTEEEPATPRLPPEMQGRPDARELREFVQAFLAISDPAERRRILDAVEKAAS